MIEQYTRFEYARIVGARALQISMGAPVLIDSKSDDPIEIALEEIQEDLVPIVIKKVTKR